MGLCSPVTINIETFLNLSGSTWEGVEVVYKISANAYVLTIPNGFVFKQTVNSVDEYHRFVDIPNNQKAKFEFVIEPAGNFNLDKRDLDVEILYDNCSNSARGPNIDFKRIRTVSGSLSAAINIYQNSGTGQGPVYSMPPSDLADCKTGVNFRVEGNFNIDTDYCVRRGIITLAPGATITVKNGNTLSLDETLVTACEDQLWNSIIVEPGATLITKNETLIRDAEIAVTAQKNSTVIIRNTIFEDNHIGIFSGGNGDLSYFAVTGTTFKSKDYLKSPREGERPFVGISFHDFTNPVFIGGGNRLPENTFEEIANGIILTNTASSIRNCSFNNIDDFSGNGFGIGINVDNKLSFSKLVNIGDHSVSNYFDNCTKGISIKNSNTKIENNIMSRMGVGIEASECKLKRVSIIDNTIETGDGFNLQSPDIGILLVQNNPSIVDVSENNISIPIGSESGLDFGIKADENFVGLSNRYQIKENVITLERGRNGIGLTGGRFTEVFNNSIQLGGNIREYGVNAEGTSDLFADCNTISGNTQPEFSDSWAMRLAGTQRFSASCNFSDDTEIGTQVVNVNSTCNLRGNTFGNHATGTLLGGRSVIDFPQQPDVFIDFQTQHNNTWEPCTHNGNNPPLGPVGAQHNSSFKNWVEAQQFIVGSPQCSDELFPKVVTPNAPSNTSWFITQSGGGNQFACDMANACPIPPTWNRAPNVTSVDLQIINNNKTPLNYHKNIWNLGERNLAGKLTENSELLEGEAIQQWFAAVQNTPAGQFAALEAQTNDALQPSDATLGAMESALATIENLQQQLAVLDTLWGTEMTEEDSLNLSVQIENLENQLATESQNLSDMTAAHIADAEVAVPGLISQNNAVNVVESFDAYEQIVNDIYLNTVALGNSEFTSEQSQILSGIANSCAYEHGQAVYAARALYALVDPFAVYEEEELCVQPQYRIGVQNEELLKATTAVLNVFPNPSKDEITIQFENLDFSKQLTIQDLTGRELRQISLNSDVQSISLDLTDVKSGIYVLSGFDRFGATISKRFIIQK